MSNESSKKVENPLEDRSVSATMWVTPTVHLKIAQYRRKISAERDQDFTLMQAYAEFVIEKTNEIELVS